MKKIALLVVLACVFALSGCSRKEEPAPVASTPTPIPQSKATEGAAFNKIFPKSSDGFDVVFTQEKDGFAQADLSKDGKKLATLQVSDTDANPSARDKFKSAAKMIDGNPEASVGSQGTAVLVANRYQVQVRSLAPAFTAADREAWLKKFKLAELAAVPARR